MSREKILFVCYANIHRSVAAEELYRSDPRYDVRSAGIAAFDGRHALTAEDISWADRVFVMGGDVLHWFHPALDASAVTNLHVPDEFDTRYLGEKAELMALLRERLLPHLGEPQG